MSPLLFWKIIGYGVLAFFALGIVSMVFSAIAPVLWLFFFVGFSLLAVVTYPIVLLIRAAGYKKFPSLFPVWQKFFGTHTEQTQERPKQKETYSQQSSNTNREQQYRKSKEPSFDPWEILEVPRNASKQEIKAAYKKKVVLNHPDKVASLDPALHTFATQRTVLLQKAYDQLIEAA